MDKLSDHLNFLNNSRQFSIFFFELYEGSEERNQKSKTNAAVRTHGKWQFWNINEFQYFFFFIWLINTILFIKSDIANLRHTKFQQKDLFPIESKRMHTKKRKKRQLDLNTLPQFFFVIFSINFFSFSFFIDKF